LGAGSRRAAFPALLLAAFGVGKTRRARDDGNNAERQSQHKSTSDSHRGPPRDRTGGARRRNPEVITKIPASITGFLALSPSREKEKLVRPWPGLRQGPAARLANLAPTNCRSWSGESCRPARS